MKSAKHEQPLSVGKPLSKPAVVSLGQLESSLPLRGYVYPGHTETDNPTQTHSQLRGNFKSPISL